jgi:hypothetical protein
MNATSNPQTAAERAGSNYRDVTSPDAAVPEAVRDMAEKAVDQSREVNDRSKDALDASFATLERTLDAAGQGAVAFNRKIIDIAQRNVNSGFDLAKSLAALRTAPIWWSCTRPIGRSCWARLRRDRDGLLGTIEIGQGTFGWKNARGKKGFKRIAWSKLADILDDI